MKKILLFCSLAVLLFSLAISAQAAAVAPKPMASQWDVLKLFQKAMVNRYADLNSNAKSGAQGVYDYIIGEAKIATTTVNNAVPPVYTRTPILQLDWFKDQFLSNVDGANGDPVLNQRDKDGIRQAMQRRYSDICSVSWNTEIASSTRKYNKAVSDAEKIRKGVKAKTGTGTAIAPQFPATANSEELCVFNYNKDLKNPAIVPARNSDYDNTVKRLIKTEELNNTKNTCINATYTDLYRARTTALATFSGEKAAQDVLRANCATVARITTWTWLQ